MADTRRVTDHPGDERSAQRLQQDAIDARRSGRFQEAALLFARAADLTPDEQARLNLQIRQACCLLAVECYDEAAALATVIADRARHEHYLPELADALGVTVDHLVRSNRLAEAAHALSEAMYLLDRLPNEPSNYDVIHNMGVTYAHSGFTEASLELFDRALRVADNDDDRQFTYASMTSAYHYSAQREPDVLERNRLLHDGVYAATAALDPAGAREVMSMCTALAHRSMMLAEIGHYQAAVNDAKEARRMASEHGMIEEQVIAMSGEAIARWRADHDVEVLGLVSDTLALGAELNLTGHLGPLQAVEVEILWELGRHDDARAALERQQRDTLRRLHDERAARWEHVRLGVEHLRVEALSTSDPLTGLPNRRHLDTLLPEALDGTAPVCVAIIDLDGFKQVNDEYGYLLGDSVLQEVAGLLERVCRRNDAVVRLGGDEFVMVLRDTSPGDARSVFERVRQLVAARTFHGLPSALRLTASIGVAVGSAPVDRTRVLADAADALQEAKRGGRDRICFR